MTLRTGLRSLKSPRTDLPLVRLEPVLHEGRAEGLARLVQRQRVSLERLGKKHVKRAMIRERTAAAAWCSESSPRTFGQLACLATYDAPGAQQPAITREHFEP